MPTKTALSKSPAKSSQVKSNSKLIARPQRLTKSQMVWTLVGLLVVGALGFGLVQVRANSQCFRLPGMAGSKQFSNADWSIKLSGDWHQTICEFGAATQDGWDGSSVHWQWASYQPNDNPLLNSAYDTMAKPQIPYAGVGIDDLSTKSKSLADFEKENKVTLSDAVNESWRQVSNSHMTIDGVTVLVSESNLQPYGKMPDYMYSKWVTIIHNGRQLNVVYGVTGKTADEVKQLRAKYDAGFAATLASIDLK